MMMNEKYSPSDSPETWEFAGVEHSDYQKTITTLQAEVERLMGENRVMRKMLNDMGVLVIEPMSISTPEIPEQIRRWEEGEGQ